MKRVLEEPKFSFEHGSCNFHPWRPRRLKPRGQKWDLVKRGMVFSLRLAKRYLLGFFKPVRSWFARPVEVA